MSEGATLVSVNSAAEHEFINQWLTKYDAFSGNKWHTSGVYQEGTIMWAGGNIRYDGPVYWNSGSDRVLDVVTHIVYRYSGGEEYGWSLIDRSAVGFYICEIPLADVEKTDFTKRGFDYGLGVVNLKDIQSGPKIISEPKSVIVVGEEVQSVTVECIAAGNPLTKYKWYRPKSNDDEEVTAAIDDRYTISGGRLTIENPNNVNDSNSYWCVVENQFGKVLGQTAQIWFGYLHDFPPVRPDDVVVRQFEGTKLDCNAPAAVPEVRHEWFTHTSTAFVNANHSTQFVSNSGHLYFSQVQFTDQKRYHCLVTLTAPAEHNMAYYQLPSKTSLGTWMYVTGTMVGEYGPIIHTQVFPNPVLRGSSIRMECIAYGSIPLYYSWKRVNPISKKEVPLPVGTVIVSRNRVLAIPNAQLKDEGDYICTCSGTKASAEKVISLVLNTKPYFTFPIPDMHVDPGATIRWRCKAVARPNPTYTWYKNGKLITEISGEIEVRNNYLYIKAVDKTRDEGMYQCGATNKHGTVYSTGQLRVLSFQPNFKKHPLPAQTFAPQGGNITIACFVEGAPEPEVIWEKDGGNLNLVRGDTSQRMGMASNNALILTSIQPSDQGYYTCKATNAIGGSTNGTFVTVVEGISIITPPVNTRVVVNGTAYLYCQAAHNYLYDLIYLWYFNGVEIDFKSSIQYAQSNVYGQNGLHIRSIQFKHEGVYACYAMTSLHTARAEAHLTVVGPPGEPVGVYVVPSSIGPFSATVIWRVGPDHGAPVTNFVIEVETQYYPGKWKVQMSGIPAPSTIPQSGQGLLKSDQRTYPVRDLIPGTSYRFRIRAVNLYGIGEPSLESVIIKTPQTAPIFPPRGVSGGGGKVGVLRVTWDPMDPSEWCGPGIGYNVYFRKKSNTDEKWEKGTIRHNIGLYVHLVGEKNFYLQYEVTVAAFNDLGPGPNSTITIIYSAEGMPITRPNILNVEAVNSTALNVYWEPIQNIRNEMRGKVDGYEITWYREDDPNLQAKSTFVYGNQDHTLIIGLVPKSRYWVAMFVFNSAGTGPISEWRLGETLNYAPQSYPQHVTVYSHGPNSVRVLWREISTTEKEESLQGYLMMYWKVHEDIRTATQVKVGKVPEKVLYGIQINEVYVLRMMGYSPGGVGMKSEAVYFTLGGTVTIDPATSQDIYQGFGHGNNCIVSFLLLTLSSLMALVLCVVEV
ncbi:hypothetical protein CHS0354_025554 [Potamilus streckersoni]|uniref:Contactin n=1 Tax=Potamilus streckersoni TaxID=2493646 RepID=A0AAE0S1M4_9BIVA|nr:hypothetical protein CHS0354_025554 [Potamilus streckersoni]